MADSPPFDETLRQALTGLNNDDVRIFFDYFEELKQEVRKHLRGQARTMPGSSAVAHSALLSLFCNLALAQCPLSETDTDGYPTLWPLLLQYAERHANKWNAYYKAKKRKAPQGPLRSDPPDYRADENQEFEFVAAWEALYAQLSDEERVILESRLRDESLQQIAARIGRSESTVSNRLARIRAVLHTLKEPTP